jgi:hypothetical protein
MRDHLGDIAMAVSNFPDFVDENSHRPSSGYYSPTSANLHIRGAFFLKRHA